MRITELVNLKGRIGFLFLAAFILLMPSFSFSEDKIIAVVNNEVITQKDLTDFINFMRMQLSREYSGEELDKKVAELKPDLVNKLIDDRLLLQEAQKIGVKIDESRIKGRLAEVKKRYPNDQVFQDELRQQGLVLADVENRIREQFLTFFMVDTRVKDKIIIRPDEVTEFYSKNKAQFVESEERILDVIILDNLDLANAISFDLKSGKKIEDLASKYPFSVEKLSVRNRGELRKDLEDEVFKLGIEEVSRPMNIDNKFYVFKLNYLFPSKQLSLSESQDKIHNFLFEQKMQAGLSNLLAELKKKSYIKISGDTLPNSVK